MYPKGPIATALLKAKLRLTLRSQGHGFFDINEILDGMDDDTVETASEMAATKVKTPAPAVPTDTHGAQVTGGPFLDFLTQFLNSEFGKALIAALIKLLTGM